MILGIKICWKKNYFFECGFKEYVLGKVVFSWISYFGSFRGGWAVSDSLEKLIFSLSWHLLMFDSRSLTNRGFSSLKMSELHDFWVAKFFFWEHLACIYPKFVRFLYKFDFNYKKWIKKNFSNWIYRKRWLHYRILMQYYSKIHLDWSNKLQQLTFLAKKEEQCMEISPAFVYWLHYYQILLCFS